MSLHEAFTGHGWLVQRAVVSAERVAELEAALDAVIPAERYADWGDRVVEVAGVSRASPPLAALACDAALGALAAAALDVPSVQLLQDTALIKPARHPGGVAWHQDWGYLAFLDRPQVITLRLTLTPCTAASGCMRVLDGSHRWGHVSENRALRWNAIEDELPDLPPALRERAAHSERLLELAPGDVSGHHTLTFHGSAPNGSDQPRKTLVLRYIDSACRLLPERLPSPEALAYFPTDAEGHLDPAAFPRVWPPA